MSATSFDFSDFARSLKKPLADALLGPDEQECRMLTDPEGKTAVFESPEHVIMLSNQEDPLVMKTQILNKVTRKKADVIDINWLSYFDHPQNAARAIVEPA